MDKLTNPYKDTSLLKQRKKRSTELIKFTEALKRRGTRGIMSLRRSFDIADSNGDGNVDLKEFKKLMKILKFELNGEEQENLFNEFDSNKNNLIEYNEFVDALIGDMPEERISRLKQVFFILDKDNSGGISIDEMKDGFFYKRHPDVLKGKRLPEEIYAEFLDNLDYHFKLLNNNVNSNEMKFEEFVDFYKNISFTISSTEDFNDIIKAVWNLVK